MKNQKMKLNVGDVFEPGQVWQTSRGTLWKVLEYDYRDGSKRVLMRSGEDGSGRKQYKLWDDVINWSIWIHADGTPTEACNESRASYTYTPNSINKRNKNGDR